MTPKDRRTGERAMDEFEKAVWAFYEASKEMIERDIGKLKNIEFRPLTVTFHGEKDARIFHRETLAKDLDWLNRQGMT